MEVGLTGSQLRIWLWPFLRIYTCNNPVEESDTSVTFLYVAENIAMPS